MINMYRSEILSICNNNASKLIKIIKIDTHVNKIQVTVCIFNDESILNLIYITQKNKTVKNLIWMNPNDYIPARKKYYPFKKEYKIME